MAKNREIWIGRKYVTGRDMLENQSECLITEGDGYMITDVEELNESELVRYRPYTHNVTVGYLNPAANSPGVYIVKKITFNKSADTILESKKKIAIKIEVKREAVRNGRLGVVKCCLDEILALEHIIDKVKVEEGLACPDCLHHFYNLQNSCRSCIGKKRYLL